MWRLDIWLIGLRVVSKCRLLTDRYVIAAMWQRYSRWCAPLCLQSELSHAASWPASSVHLYAKPLHLTISTGWYQNRHSTYFQNVQAYANCNTCICASEVLCWMVKPALRNSESSVGTISHISTPASAAGCTFCELPRASHIPSLPSGSSLTQQPQWLCSTFPAPPARPSRRAPSQRYRLR